MLLRKGNLIHETELALPLLEESVHNLRHLPHLGSGVLGVETHRTEESAADLTSIVFLLDL